MPRGKSKLSEHVPPMVPKSRKRDLAEEFHSHPGTGALPGEARADKDPTTGRFVKGNQMPGVGRKLGGNNDTVKAIKAYMLELLDDENYRRSLTRRIRSGELPQIELFLLTKALGKPKEEIEVTTNVPLFALPTTFRLKEDEVEADGVKVLEAGDENGGNEE